MGGVVIFNQPLRSARLKDSSATLVAEPILQLQRQLEQFRRGHQDVSFLHPRMQGESLRILLILIWRPRRDLNPCYRRKIGKVPSSTLMASYLQSSITQQLIGG